MCGQSITRGNLGAGDGGGSAGATAKMSLHSCNRLERNDTRFVGQSGPFVEQTVQSCVGIT